ncbi:unnamed protein product [Vitrella brassicaformis CCMP3155]|uniref:Major facilitator superfamily (MFS) profile domain-containing protein n=2 Tax=Vitrella brassicaformis TaxID=1169539 RepID=A0A0G4E9F9_VITBC|nr:unnamed protein product [Vitrella brassicaformis CCMP3155]|eukprot:CEL91864.1 unnamed protein product [Vitrella brassicaformis CCMP3155]
MKASAAGNTADANTNTSDVAPSECTTLTHARPTTTDEPISPTIDLSSSLPSDEQHNPKKDKHKGDGRVPGITRYNRNFAFWCSMFCTFWVFSHQYIAVAFLPPLLLKRGIGDSTIGLLFALFPFASFAASPFCGTFIQRVGAPVGQFVSLLLMGATCVIFGFTTSLPLYFILRGLQGLGVALYTESMYALVTRMFPHDIPYRVGLTETSIGLGCCSGRVIGAFLYGWMGFAAPFEFQAIILFTSAVIGLHVFTCPSAAETASTSAQSTPVEVEGSMSYTPPRPVDVAVRDGQQHPPHTAAGHGHEHEHEHGHERHHHVSFWAVLRPSVVTIGIAVLLSSSTYTFYDPVLAPHLHSFFGPLSDWVVGIVMALTSFVYMLASVATGRVASTYGLYPSLTAWGFVIAFVAYQMLGPSPFLYRPGIVKDHSVAAWVLQLVGQTLAAIGNGMSFVPAVPWMQQHVEDMGEEAKEMTIAVVVMFLSLGEGVAPLLSGILTEYLGYDQAAAIFSYAYITFAVCIFVWERKQIFGHEEPLSGLDSPLLAPGGQASPEASPHHGVTVQRIPSFPAKPELLSAISHSPSITWSEDGSPWAPPLYRRRSSSISIDAISSPERPGGGGGGVNEEIPIRLEYSMDEADDAGDAEGGGADAGGEMNGRGGGREVGRSESA